jgi:hypothetical protein
MGEHIDVCWRVDPLSDAFVLESKVQGTARQAAGPASCLQAVTSASRPSVGFVHRGAESEDGAHGLLPAMDTGLWAASGSASV